jgi:acetolactate synthase small subunit
MSMEHLHVHTADEHGLRAIVSTLGSRGVSVESIAATRSRSPANEGYEVRLVVDSPNPERTERIVRQLDRLVTVVTVVHVTEPPTTAARV